MNVKPSLEEMRSLFDKWRKARSRFDAIFAGTEEDVRFAFTGFVVGASATDVVSLAEISDASPTRRAAIVIQVRLAGIVDLTRFGPPPDSSTASSVTESFAFSFRNGARLTLHQKPIASWSLSPRTFSLAAEHITHQSPF
jgi:hypothetical protein